MDLFAAVDGILDRLSINEWDLLLVGDGSGSKWVDPCGWACVGVTRHTRAVDVWWGAASRGSVNFAEAMAYLQALECYSAAETKRRSHAGYAVTRVHIVTDSSYCQNTGNGTTPPGKVLTGIWAAFAGYTRLGFNVKWHWRERNSDPLGEFCDRLSKLGRAVVKTAGPTAGLPAPAADGETR